MASNALPGESSAAPGKASARALAAPRRPTDDPLWHAVQDAVLAIERDRLITRRPAVRRNAVVAELYRAVVEGGFVADGGVPLGQAEARQLAAERRRARVLARAEFAAGPLLWAPLLATAVLLAPPDARVARIAHAVLAESVAKVTLAYTVGAVVLLAGAILLLAGLHGLAKHARSRQVGPPRLAAHAAPVVDALLILWRALMTGPLALLQLYVPLALVTGVAAARAGNLPHAISLWLLGATLLGGLWIAGALSLAAEDAARKPRLMTVRGSLGAIGLGGVLLTIAVRLAIALSVMRL